VLSVNIWALNRCCFDRFGLGNVTAASLIILKQMSYIRNND